MKHKPTFFAVIMIALAIPQSVRAYDFSAMNASSNYRTLYYNITSDSTVEVTDYNFYNRTISGLLKIPASVTYNGSTYSVTGIYGNAFSLCENITSLIIPETMLYLGETSTQGTAFQGCTNIVSIQVDTNNPVYDSRNNCNAIVKTGQNKLVFGCTTTIIPNTVECIGYGAFSHCSNLTSITLPNSITKLEPHSFSYCNRLKSINLPNGVDTIGYMAFMSCDSLEEVVMTNHLKYLGSSAFWKCHHLTNISLSDSITTIPYGLFEECTSLSSIVIPSNVTTIGQGAFQLCYNLQSIAIPSTINIIDKYTFNGCNNLQNITIPATVIRIEDYAFQGCSSLQSIIIPNAVTSIGKYAFAGCTNINNLSFGENISSIDNRAFYNCDRISQIELPKKLKTIGQSCFSHCDSLVTVIMYDSLELIDGNTFNSCPNLRAIYISTPIPPSIGMYTNSFQLHNSLLTKIYVPCGTKSQYVTAWGHSSNTFSEDWLPYGLVTSVNNPDWGTLDVSSCSPNATLTAIPEYGFHFSRWDDGNLLNPRIITITQDTSVKAIFDESYITIAHSSNDTSMGVTIGVDSCRLGLFATIAAVPYDGFKFSHWSNGVIENPYSFIATHDTSLIAIFTHIDTIFINIHDTTYVDVPYAIHDTTYVDVYVHDTAMVIDTVTLMEYIPVHDTTFINVYVHDTTTIIDTLTLIEYMTVHDTTYIDVHDTTYIDVPYAVHDTIYITLTDTVINTIYDTITNTVYDTVTNTVYDTIDNFVYDTLTLTDTLWLTQTDTLWLHDTVIIHDTVYITQEGVDGVEAMNAKVYSSNGQIVVDGAAGNIVWLYDVNGRVLATKQDEYMPLRFDAPASGTYLIKIGGHPARKVVVIR